LGPEFPGVGKQFTQRFVEKHSDRLKTAWSTPLENKRGRAVNHANNDAWFKLLGEELGGVEEECIFAVDEVGIQPSGGQRESV
ncbi:hypothetical protein EDD18DRAFT_1084579, partial [Armillaria luteobubalina]